MLEILKQQLSRVRPHLGKTPEPRNGKTPLPIVEAARRDIPDVLASLHTTPNGLSTAEAETRHGIEGPNEIAHDKPPRWYVQLFHALNNPFNWLLLVLAVVSRISDAENNTAGIVILLMVLLSTLLRFFQEYRSNQAAEKLKAMVSTTATVSRADARTDVPQEAVKALGVNLSPQQAAPIEVPIKELVPGDVIRLSAGDMVPADVRLLQSKDLFISQSILTGESLPVEKFDVPNTPIKANCSTPDLPTVCFMGTNVISGSARAVVVAIGPKTYFGSICKNLGGSRPTTSFDKGINSVSWLLIRFMLVMVPIIFVINGVTKHDWVEAFMFGVASAVGLTPEMLPMIVTANLARGAVAMSRRKVIVKRLNAIQNLGAMDVLCTDKTGTLTQDKVILLRHLDINAEESDDVLEYAYLNSYFQTGLKNLLDVAVLQHQDLVQTKELTKRYIKYDEVPFDFNRRRMSVIVHEVFRGRDLLICKGAVEEIMSICKSARIDDQIIPMHEDIRDKAVKLKTDMNEDGLRVIAVAYKVVDSMPGRAYGVADESDLILCGYVAFLDPPKESAAPAIAALKAHGVTVKVLTGDNELVARKVCREVGLDVSHTVSGGDLDAVSDCDMPQVVEETTLFAKLSPPQKARVIKALKQNGHTVGFLGDGINDAPALRDADVGVSVDTGADVARESADVILLEKSLLVLEEGVIAGRTTFANILKYIKMAASSNFGNVFSVLVASIWLPFLPMVAIQMLVQNLLYDISQVGIPFDSVDKEYLEKPRKWEVGNIGRFMIFIGPISSIFDITTFLILWHVFGFNTLDKQGLFQAGWFIEGLLSQTLIIHMIRTSKVPFFQSTASAPLMLMTLVVMAVGVWIPFSLLAASLQMRPAARVIDHSLTGSLTFAARNHMLAPLQLPGSYFLWLAATLLSYCVLTQFVKMWYIRRFKSWL
jgi:P-type Mg2+ transporter